MPFLADLRVRRFDYLEFRCRLQHPEGRKERCVLGSGRHTMRVYMVKVVTHVCVHTVPVVLMLALQFLVLVK